mmetsp:Transcript_15674/g.24387  ORF Transcript_15674/g.24387 Transcript_15674/m.24387 type:complete len:85 (+) Transcript_15674:1142-1396(+)
MSTIQTMCLSTHKLINDVTTGAKQKDKSIVSADVYIGAQQSIPIVTNCKKKNNNKQNLHCNIQATHLVLMNFQDIHDSVLMHVQ